MHIQSAWLPWLVVLTILAILLISFSPVVFIRAGHRGVATFFGDTQGEVLAPGLHFKYPLLRVHQFDTRIKVRDVSAGVITSDMQLATLGLAVSYRLETDEIRHLFEVVGADIETKLIDPAAKEALNVVATQFRAEELVLDRNAFKASLVTELTTRLGNSGVALVDVAVVSVTFSQTLQAAFESTTVAKQEAQTMELQYSTAKLQAEVETVVSDSEAERIQILGDVLRGREAYIQYEIMKKWDGKSPLYLSPASPVQIVTGRE